MTPKLIQRFSCLYLVLAFFFLANLLIGRETVFAVGTICICIAGSLGVQIATVLRSQAAQIDRLEGELKRVSNVLKLHEVTDENERLRRHIDDLEDTSGRQGER